MNDTNPYATPKAALLETKDETCTREGKWVVVKTGSDLPPRCIICNAAVTTPIKRKTVYWHSPWLYLLILLNILVYVIVGLIFRKTFKVSAGLCKLHAAKRKKRILTFSGIGVASFVVAVLLFSREIAGVAIVFFVLALILLLFAAIVARTVYPREITKEYARLGGCKEPFLASLE
jgi:hypothetical protein